MEIVKIGFYFILYFLEFFAAFVILYFAFSFIVLYFPINPNYKQKGELTEIYLKSNGVHADIIIPITHKFDWHDWIGKNHFESQQSKYIGIGWGDKGFYVDTPEWSDLRFSTAFQAVFLNSQTLMHVTLHDKPELGKNCKSLLIDQHQYEILIKTIKSRFKIDTEGNPLLMKGVGYTPDDNFFEAHGSYSLFMTCNVWANNVLKAIKVKTVYWSPFDNGVMKYL